MDLLVARTSPSERCVTLFLDESAGHGDVACIEAGLHGRIELGWIVSSVEEDAQASLLATIDERKGRLCLLQGFSTKQRDSFDAFQCVELFQNL